ncbi:response regulator [Parabacteroides faecis]|uniref:hybrid sensor histidine kinase/response regulator transcription factor n=1 Tax=Parabacteroides faecis TaxID=1217282 RepID=UPI003A8DF31C
MYNLLSNAFKYNKINGKVKITLSPEGAVSDFEYKRLTVTVGNTGIGISEKHIHSIFQRFYEINYKDSEKRGNGIGLSLTKSLVELHNGTIQVTSIPNEWTEFSFSIPLGKTAYREEQIEDNNGIHSPEILPDIATTECAETTQPEKSEESQTDKKHSILVIEDNEELLQSIRNLLATQFIVYTTTNGSEGIDIAQSKNPELILSDIMMPGMNGFEVCRTIKQEISTSHIPVVLLSAKISDEDKLEGFQVSADAYITKPFNFQLLKAQLLSIIENRELTAQKFKSTPLTQSIQVSLTSMDEKILNRAIDAVEKNIENPEFDLQAFTEEMNISNSMLYRKLKSLTNLSPNEFIRNIRLKASCKLLLEQKGNISEVAYRVGFNDAKYFSRCFKKEFDMTPMEYIEQNKTKES